MPPRRCTCPATGRAHDAPPAALALRTAAGLHTPSATEFQILNLTGGTPSVIDILDAAAIANRAANPS